jgi:predicted  nucleic acid-binding Zn-ribbon protein
MAGAIGTLRELHRLRQHIKRLQDEINRVPLQIKGQNARIARQEEEIKAAHDDLKHLKVAIHTNEVALKEAHQRIAKFESQIDIIQSKRENDALQHEIAHEQKHCGELEEAILGDMTRAEDDERRIAELDKALKQGKAELAQFEQTSKGRVAELSAELQRAQGQLKEVEGQLPDDIRPQYERLVGAMGEDALSLAKDRTCSACYSGLTQQQHNDLLAGRLVTCKSCGRIVYLADESL